MRYTIGDPARAAESVAGRRRPMWAAAAGISRPAAADTAGEIELNALPAQYLSTSRSARSGRHQLPDRATVPNPFRGLMPGTSFNGATIARRSCCGRSRTSTTSARWRLDGTSSYNSAQFKLEKRFTQGYTVLAGYTWSKFTEKVFKLNPDRRGLRRAAVGVRRAAPLRGQRHLGAAVRTRPRWAQRARALRRCVRSAAGACRRSARCRAAGRSASTTATSTSTAISTA